MFGVRLFLDLVAISLVVLCLAYWWLDNLSHELFGTALFLLVTGHNVFNRRWYGGGLRAPRDVARLLNIGIIGCLAALFLTMLVTSVLISRDLFPSASFAGGFGVREIHMFAAYWLLFVLALHLGTRWSVVMAATGSMIGTRQPSPIRALILRLVAILIALWGVKSSQEMAFGSKLTLTYSLDMWDFNASTSGFFVNYLSIIGLWAAIAHYGIIIVRRLSNGTKKR